MLGQTLVLDLESVEAVVEVKFFVRYQRGANDYSKILVDLPRSSLASIWLEAIDQDSQRLTCLTIRTFRVKQGKTEPPPTFLQPVLVFLRRNLAGNFVLQTPRLSGKVS